MIETKSLQRNLLALRGKVDALLAALTTFATNEDDDEPNPQPKKAHVIELNATERAIVDKLHRSESMQVSELAKACFVGAKARPRAKNLKQANMWGRNALRRPLREGLIRRIGTGLYGGK